MDQRRQGLVGMEPSERQDVSLTGRRFASQLLRSHLHVAGVGLLVVVIALGSILFLRVKIHTVLRQWQPLDRVGAQIQNSVALSRVGLKGWAFLGDGRHLSDWERSWRDGIHPAMDELARRTARLDDQTSRAAVEGLRPLLQRLWIRQWQVRDVARSPGNEPARVAFQEDVEPVADELRRLLDALARMNHGRNSADHQDHVTLMALDRLASDALVMLESFVDHGEAWQEVRFRELMVAANHTFTTWSVGHVPVSPEEPGLIAAVRADLIAVEMLAGRVIELRTSRQWNLALALMNDEVVPLAERVGERLRVLYAHIQGVMDHHSAAATRVAVGAAALLSVLLLLMMITAFLLSRRRALMLTRPIQELVQGANDLAEGRLDRDIPVTGDDELGELTRAFNGMRAALDQSRSALEQTNLALEQRADDVSQANRELRDFVYIVSHDLRSPLLSIQGFMEELRMDLEELDGIIEAAAGGLDEAHRKTIHDLFENRFPEEVRYIEAATAKMDGLINAVLKLSRLGRGVIQPEPLDLRAMAEENVRAMAHAIKGAGAMVTVGSLPNLVSDRTALEQIIGNLLGNAVKYLDLDRPGSVVVDGEADPIARTVTLRVRDNGRGIDREDIPKIFTLFQRVGPQDRSGEGVGLAYVRALVNRLGGRIFCESAPGRGTVFTVRLPMTPPEADTV